jgi:hypothetical protein
MKKTFMMLLVFMGIFSVLFHPGCKTSGDSGPWALTVSVGEGIIGSPAAGSYSYDDSTTVTYDYSLQPKYGNLAVTLDGAAIANSGSINMDGDHNLSATATIDVRGDTWTGHAHHDGTPSWKVYNLQFTFTGNITSGTATGKIETLGNISGTWTLSGSDFTINMIVKGSPLDMIGTMATASYMNGTYDVEGEHPGERITGTWYLER